MNFMGCFYFNNMISVDTVYQRVLAILNKEQRGFLTPQKFNLYANQVQLEILESYFYELEYYLKQKGNSTQVADMVDILQTKIAKFEADGVTTYSSNNHILPSDLYRLDLVLVNGIEANSLSRREHNFIKQSPIGKPSNDLPVYTETRIGIKVYGDVEIVTPVDVLYIRTPDKVEWVATVVDGDPLYNAGASTNFDLDPSEETDLVIRILRFAGVEVKDLSLYQVAATEEAQEDQIEKM